MVVLVAAQEHNDRAHKEDQSRQEVREPETNTLLSVDHGDLANDGTNVDHHVEDHVDPLNGRRWVNNNPLTRLQGLDEGLCVLILLGDQR